MQRVGLFALCVTFAVHCLVLRGEEPTEPTSSGDAGKQAETPQAEKETTETHRRKRVAVVDFEVPLELIQTPQGQGEVVKVRAAATRLGTVLSDMLISALVNAGNFDVIERTQLTQLLEENQLNQQGLLDPETVSKAGKLLGVDLILGGKLTEFGVKEKKSGGLGIASRILLGVAVDVRKSTARAVVDTRLIDARTGRILFAKQGTGENKESGFLFGGTDFATFLGGVSFNSAEWTESRIGKATRTAVEQVVAEFVKSFPLEATILASLSDDSLILDVGKFAGIRETDQFLVVRETLVTDEETGETLWKERKELGRIEVVEVQEERSRCRPAKAATFSERPRKGDIAVLERPEAEEPAKKEDAPAESKKKD